MDNIEMESMQTGSLAHTNAHTHRHSIITFNLSALLNFTQ
jgi:hypothetical protein